MTTTIDRMLAQSTVKDVTASEEWYSRLFGREPDERPMPGCLEWHLNDLVGVQVYADPERAGRSTVVLEVSDVDDAAKELDRAGIAHPEPSDATKVRVMMVDDPDGNRVVFSSGVAKGQAGAVA